MSIIFDALKRAEAQRQKGQSPTLATRVVPPNGRINKRVWILTALFVLMGAGAWWLRPTSDTEVRLGQNPATPNVSVPGVIASNAKPTATPSTRSAGAPDLTLTNTPAQDQPSVVATDLTQRTASAAPLSMPSLDVPLTGAARFKPELPAELPNQQALSAPTPIPQPISAPTSTAATNPYAAETPISTGIVSGVIAAPANPPTTASAGLPTVFELDYQVRHDLPKMAVSMYVYNAQPQFRFVIISGKRIAEGEQIEGKVTIAQIRADGLECDFQGKRFFYPRQSL
jgi:general secretion pathway protein B